MTFTQIKADISSFLGMTIGTSSRVTTSEIEQWCNQDYRTAQSKMADANINYYQGEIQKMDTVADTGRYQLPTGFLAMKRLEIQFSDDTDKVRVSPADINDIYSTLDPENDPWNQKKPFYALWEDDFYIKPVPDETSSSWTTDSGNAMKLWFVELQDDLSASGDVPALPITFHHILAYGATAKGFRKLRKFTEAREYEALLRTGLAEMVSENTHKDKTKPMGFTIIRGTTRRSGIYKPSGSVLGSNR